MWWTPPQSKLLLLPTKSYFFTYLYTHALYSLYLLIIITHDHFHLPMTYLPRYDLPTYIRIYLLPTYIRIYFLPTYLPAFLICTFVRETVDLDVSYFLPTGSYLFYVPTDLSLSLSLFPATPRSLCVSVCGGVCFVACALHRGCRCASAAIVAGINPSCSPHSHRIIEESKRDKRERNRNTTVFSFCHFFLKNSAEYSGPYC